LTPAGGELSAGRLSYVWRPSAACGAAVFIHGLGADAAQTWGADQDGAGFLGRLLRLRPGFAVACYDYPSRLGLPGQNGLPPMAKLSERLGATIRDELLPAYERVAIVAYCLGGLVTRFALASGHSIEPGIAPYYGRLTVFFLDSPEDWPDGPLDLAATVIARRLAVGERALRANAAWWADRSGPAGQVEDHAVVSGDHCWVTPFKPGSTVPGARVLRSGIGHLDLARPSAADPHQAYDYVAAHLSRYFGEPGERDGRAAW
jgi:hypothetical protein